jgi:hypothetical protein
MRRLLLLAFLLGIHGCVLTQRTFIRNDTDAALIVSVQQESKAFGWARKEVRTVPLPARTICSVRHNISYDTFLYIESIATGRSTNITALKYESYVYSVSDTGGKQVVAIAEANSETERLFPKRGDQCVAIEPTR